MKEYHLPPIGFTHMTYLNCKIELKILSTSAINQPSETNTTVVFWVWIDSSREQMGGKVCVQWVVAVFFLVLVGGGSAIILCNIDSNQLNYCLPAVRTSSPPPPTETCCNVVQQANLPCLCSYLSVLPVFGIDPVAAVALPSKCGMETPPECHGKSPLNPFRV